MTPLFSLFPLSYVLHWTMVPSSLNSKGYGAIHWTSCSGSSLADEKDVSYPSEFSFAFFHYYLKNIVIMCRLRAWHLLGVMRSSEFVGAGALEKNKSYPSEFSSIFFCYYLKNIVIMCRSRARMNDSLAFTGWSTTLVLFSAVAVEKNKS